MASKHKFVQPKNNRWRGQSLDGYKPYKKIKKKEDPDVSAKFLASLNGISLEQMKKKA